ncbi:hypothetical protein [Peredibacter starrii]|uniref:Peptidase C80 domain-containing protein n=1 Tax=Peredibacter starrii TaxID=28202 RepID=A0AAX4HNU9_9BACT|nr:hypothetical protein [Peredibacter starrii]WPU64865.1 hypothetical protein SOO65_19405 [Peredibacter starrii]
MKKLIPVATLLVSIGAHAQCNKKVDPNKVILFIDTNNSELEIATTEKAACERGERLMVVPKNHKEYIKYTNAVIASTKKVERCRTAKTDCTSANAEYEKAQQELDKLSRSNKNISKQTQEALAEIKNSGAKLQNLTISGHDGGGHFGGYKGDFGRQELAAIMKNFKDINEVKSVLLLGCYTGVPKEIIEWKHIFPEVKIIAGYDGSAPLSDKPAGHQYISDILLKEKSLLKNAEQKKLQSYAKQNIQGLTQMNAAMYVYCSDGTKEGEFYYGSLKEGKAFRPFDINECEGKRNQIEELISKVNQYYSGELEVPKNTASGELRQIYNEARRIEHCGEILQMELNLNAVFNLLFYEGAKQNFANYYKDDLAEAEKILSEFKLEDMEKGFNEAQEKQNKFIESIRAEIESLEKNPEAAVAAEQKKLEEFTKKRDALFNDPKFARVKSYINPENGAYNGPMDLAENLVPLAQELMNSAMTYSALKYTAEAVKANPQGMVLAKRQVLVSEENNQKNQILAFQQLKEKLAKPENKVWVPTAKNLSSKTRKETLANIHNAHAILSVEGLPAKQRQALSWMVQASSAHLGYFQNPFSWHEFTGRTEDPQFPIRLKDYTSGQGYMGGGGGYVGPAYYGGYTGSGYPSPMGMGGIAGGMMGGATTGGYYGDGGIDEADEDNAYSDESEE